LFCAEFAINLHEPQVVQNGSARDYQASVA
jgi:hypothetical protein